MAAFIDGKLFPHGSGSSLKAQQDHVRNALADVLSQQRQADESPLSEELPQRLSQALTAVDSLPRPVRQTRPMLPAARHSADGAPGPTNTNSDGLKQSSNIMLEPDEIELDNHFRRQILAQGLREAFERFQVAAARLRFY